MKLPVLAKPNAFQAKYLKDPLAYSKDILGTPGLTDYQVKAFKTILAKSKVAIASAHGLGKTYLMAEVVLTLLYLLGPKCTVITTAPTARQVEKLLWAEITEKFNNAKYNLGGRLLTTEIKVEPKKNPKWLALGFSTNPKNKQGDSSRFQGFHNNQVVIVFDEATGIQKDIYDSAESMLTSANVKWICIGNPTDPSCEFAKLFKKFDWTKIKWPCFVSPNLIENGITNLEQLRSEASKVASLPDDEKMQRMASYSVVAPQLLTTQWVISNYLAWGEESPLFQGKALAEFPELSDDSVFSVKRMEECMELSHSFVEEISSTTESIGVDVARFGSDKTCLFGLKGNVEVRKELFSKKDTTYIYGRLKQIAHQNTANGIKTVITIDSGAMGPGVIDPLVNDTSFNKKFVVIREVNFGQDALDTKQYVNAVTEMYMLASKQADTPEGFVLSLDENMQSELCSRKRKYDSEGRFMIESKDDFKKRIGHSPDSADAFVLAWYGVNKQAQASGFFAPAAGPSIAEQISTHSSKLRSGGW